MEENKKKKQYHIIKWILKILVAIAVVFALANLVTHNYIRDVLIKGQAPITYK